ncbi:MAG: putative metal-binding motif-containing protein [Chitinophagaceae bacterium]|nr:putative metal-binding motif-containing protein [Chitinophagaceae bacterium]
MKIYTQKLLTVLLFFQCLIAANLFAQVAPVKEWDRSYGSTRSDDLFVVVPTTDGGYLLGGDSDSPIGDDKSQGSQGFTDYWICKTDAFGIKQWDKRYGGNGKEELFSVIQTTDGGYLLGGHTASTVSGDQTQVSRGGRDYWIVKTDSVGNKLWDKRFGGDADDELRNTFQTADGGYLLIGESKSGISGEKTQSNHGDFDLWLVRTNAGGNLVWEASYGGSDAEQANIVRETPGGNIIIGAWTISPIGFEVSEAGKGATDMWLIKTDANGQKLWDHRFGGNDNEYLYAMDETQDGGFILGGYTLSDVNGDVTVAGKGGYDFWLVKTDGNGLKLWDKRYGGLLDDKGKSIYETSDGGFVLGGWSESGISGDKTQDTKGATDYWVLRTDAFGNMLWDLDLGGNGDERLHDVPQTFDGGFIIGGHSNSGNNGDKSQANKGLSDYWILKLSPDLPQQTFYADADADGYGNVLIDTLATVAPAGYVSDFSDCNDQDIHINPGAIDICNLIDDNCNGITDENSFTATITPTGTVKVCKGTDATLSANTTPGISYQWLKDGAIISNATGNSYTTSKKGDYQVNETNAFSCLSTAPATTIKTLSKPDAVITPAGNLDICSTGSVLLQANGGNNLSYQWKKDGILLAGATNQNYTATEAGNYKVTVSKNNGCKKVSATVSVVKSCRQSVGEAVDYNDALSVYPNPAPGIFKINLAVAPYTDGSKEQDKISAELKVTNVLNQVIYATTISLTNGKLNAEVTLPPSTPNGIYTLKILMTHNYPSPQLQWVRQVIIAW